MPASITGKVFDDVNHSGIYEAGEPGIQSAYVVIRDPNGVCTSVQTDVNGDYDFTNLTVVGTYTIYETVADPGAICPPTTFEQPAGFNNSTSIRVQTVDVIQNDIDNDVVLVGPDFGHDNAPSNFPCLPLAFQIVQNDLFTQNLVTGALDQICTIGFSSNALGYNEQDGYLYLMRFSRNTMYRVDSDCNITRIGDVPNLPSFGGGYNSGAIDENGYYYIGTSSTAINGFYTIDLTDPNSPTWGQLVDPTAGYAPATSPYITPYVGISNLPGPDIVYNIADGLLYSMGINPGELYSIDPATGNATAIPTTGVENTGGYGAAYSDLDGNLYFVNNSSGKVYRVTTDGVTATGEEFSQSIGNLTNNDGASCVSAAVEVDYGDAPDTDPLSQGIGNYRTLLASDGPRHQIGLNDLYLGMVSTGEEDAYQSPDALGDDQVQAVQDDAVTSPLQAINLVDTAYSLNIDVTNESGEDANLYAWIDFNQDGVFQTNEGFTTVVPNQIGIQTVPLNFSVPGGTTLTEGDAFLRIRITTDDLVNTGAATEEDTRSYGPAGDGEVEDYLIIIQGNPDLVMTKSVDLGFADIGDTLTYSVVVENVGDGVAQNITFSDAIPPGTTFVPGSITVDGVSTPGDLNTGIPLSDLAPGESHTVEFQVSVDGIPTPNPIENTATADYESLGGEELSSDSNTVATQVNHADLIGENGENFVKSVDPEFADIGDTITYSFTIENTGNAPATNVVLTDPIPSGTSFVAGSVVVNGFPSGDNPATGINVPSIPAGGSATVEFQVTVDEIPDPNPIPDTGTLDYQYTVDPNEPPIDVTGDSNEVTTEVKHADLIGENGENFVKSVDPELADIGDILTYSFTIENTGNTPAIDVVLTDPIPSGTSFVAGSVLVNGVPSADNPEVGIDIPDIAPGATVSFQVRVEEIPDPNPIPDTGSLDYGYLVDPNEPPVTANGDSNEVTTEVKHADLLGENGENFVKSVDPEFADVGDTITYSFTIENTGNTPAENVVLTDPIPNGTSYVEGSLLVNGVATGDNPESGINIPDIAPGDTATVSFEVLVEEIPDPNPIPDTGSLDYQYTVDPDRPPVDVTGDSNEVTTQVNNADLIGENGENFVKDVEPKVAEVGDEATYTYMIENTGNVPAINVVLSDPLPSSVTFIPGSTRVNGLSSADSPVTGISIPDILPGAIATVSFKVTVDEVPDPNPMINIGSISYDYTVDPDEPPVSGGGNSNEADLKVEVVDLEIVKSVDKETAEAGEELTFSVVVSNNGTITGQKVLFRDPIPAGTKFVADSVVVDGVPQIGANPANGINLGDIPPGDFVTIDFKVIIDDPATVDPIENQASIDYQVQVDPDGPIDDRTDNSNIVEVDIELAELTIVKMSDKSMANISDIITYTIVVTNTGTVTAENVVITDNLVEDLAENLVLVENSVTINGTQLAGADPSTGINIGNIEPGEDVVITFEVEVIKAPCPSEIVNQAQGDFEYNLEGREGPFADTAESNEVTVDISVKIFKQLSIDETLEIPPQKPDAEDVLDVDVQVEILSTIVIDIPSTTSYEGQKLTGYKIIVEGVLKQLVSYVADRDEQDVHGAHFEVPFSTFLIAPPDFNPNQNVKVNYLIEDVYIELLDPRTIFKNVTLLLRVNNPDSSSNGC